MDYIGFSSEAGIFICADFPSSCHASSLRAWTSSTSSNAENAENVYDHRGRGIRGLAAQSSSEGPQGRPSLRREPQAQYWEAKAEHWAAQGPHWEAH
jgi:hypothetical protein